MCLLWLDLGRVKKSLKKGLQIVPVNYATETRLFRFFSEQTHMVTFYVAGVRQF